MKREGAGRYGPFCAEFLSVRYLTLPFRIAPLPEQTRIADQLDTLLARIQACQDRLEVIPALLKRFRQAVLNSAVTGTLLEADGKAASAWARTTVGAIAVDVRYGTSKKCTYAAAGHGVLRIPNIAQHGRIDLTDLKRADFDAKEVDKLALREGDLLVIRSNGSVDLVGSCSVVTAAEAGFGAEFSDDSDMFYALEALDVSDLIREVMVWVTRDNDATGDVGYSDLSDGERQLLMVLGLIRISRGQRVLFLLDEPDTHLNPYWQHSYLDLIKEWTGIAADADKSHIVLTTHNPLTISALTHQEVRVMHTDKTTGFIQVTAPFVDPKGLGIGGVLTDIFGMSSTLDRPTQELIDNRNRLARLGNLTVAQAHQLEIINDKPWLLRRRKERERGSDASRL